MTANYNDVVRRGDTYKLQITIKDAAGVAIDLTGRTYAGSLVPDGSSTRTNFSVDSTELASGIVTISLSTSTTAGLTVGTYYYDFQETVGSETVTLMAGRLEVVEGITP